MNKIKQIIKNHIGITNLQTQISEIKKELVNLQEENIAKDNYIKTIEHKNEILNQKIASTDGWLKKTRDDFWESHNKISDLEKQIHTLSQLLENKTKNNSQDIKNNSQEIKNIYEQLQELKNSNFQSHQMLQYDIYKYMDSDKYAIALTDWYYKKTGKDLNLEHPQTYNEIIQWTKLFDMGAEKIALVDKYLVRNWVQKKIGEHYLVPLIGKWDSVDDIDFNALPDKFVLKCNHGCGYNIIVTDKTGMDQQKICQKLNDWLHEDFSFKNGFELQYSKIKRCIIAEEYIENNNEDLYDYKVFCFNGKAKYILFLSNRKNGLKGQIYDTNWKLQPFVSVSNKSDDIIEKPGNLSELIECAEKLAEGFLQVRIDFYRLNNGSWKFGEMTFTPASGIADWEPAEYDHILGNMINFDF